MTDDHRVTRTGTYDAAIKHIFFSKYRHGISRIDFSREEISQALITLGRKPILNLGDVPYRYRYRQSLPIEITATAPNGKEWSILPTGDGKYCFQLTGPSRIIPNTLLAESRLPDATPGIIEMYAKGDEQALLARLRYNRLLDIFTGIACYSLQSHLRTKVKNMGQGEIDEIYVGIDRRGAHYILPVQAKGGRDQISLVQIEQDIRICSHAFTTLICKPIAAQFVQKDLIALFEFEQSTNSKITVLREKHYRLVSPDELTSDELAQYSKRAD